MKAHALALAHNATDEVHWVVERAAAYFEFLKSGVATARPPGTPPDTMPDMFRLAPKVLQEPIRETAPLPTQIPVAVIGDPAPPPAPGPVTNIPFTSELSPDPAPPLSALPAQLPADNAGAATMTTDPAPQPAS